MHGHIHNLRCRYRIIGARDSASGFAARLDRLAARSVVEACAEALEQALGDDATVYVVRRVTSQCALALDLTDQQLAQYWGQLLAKTIMQRLARDTDDAEQVVRFASQAEYVAHFVNDMLQGSAGSRWYYHPFLALQALEPRAALHAVLEENRAHAHAILAHLHQLRGLERFLVALGVDGPRALWADQLRGVIQPTAATARPLFVAAQGLATRLGLGTLPPATTEERLLAYLRSVQAPVDWRDRRGLSAAVFDMLRWLRAQGDICAGDSTHTRHSAQSESALDTRANHDEPWRTQIASACAELDWLDTAWLELALTELLSVPTEHATGLHTHAPAASAPPPAMPARPRTHGPTARQRQLLADLAATFSVGNLQLDLRSPDSPDNALRLYAALLARAPQWAADPLAAGLIEHLLDVWATSVAAPSQPPVARVAAFLTTFGESAAVLLDLLNKHSGHRPPQRSFQDLTQARVELAADAQPAAESDTLGGYGAKAGPGTEGAARAKPRPLGLPAHVGAAWTPTGARPAARSAAWSFDTECAGVLLLLRGLLDTKLPALVGQISAGDSEIASAYLIALGARWAGQAGVLAGQIDPALALLAGIESVPDLSTVHAGLARFTSEQQAQLQAALLQTLVGQRVVGGTALHLYDIPYGRQRALIVGDEMAGALVFGAIMRAPEDARALLPIWMAQWEQATGRQPRIVAEYTPLLAHIRGTVTPIEIVGAPSDAAADHQARATALIGALGALEVAQLGLPHADLAIALTAIAVLRVWARWLRQFSTSSAAYVLEHFVRRPGRVFIDADNIIVELARGPLDIVLEMSSYTAEIEQLPWLGRRRVRYRFQS